MREKIAMIPWRVLHAVSTVTSGESDRPELQCVAIQRLKEHPEHGFVVATTGYMLLAVRQPTKDWSLELRETILVPPNFLPAKKTFGNDQLVTIRQDKKETRLESDGYGISTARDNTDLEYPDWTRVLPANNTAKECGHFEVNPTFFKIINATFSAMLGTHPSLYGTQVHLTQKGLGPIILHPRADTERSILGLIMPLRHADDDLTPALALDKLYRGFWGTDGGK